MRSDSPISTICQAGSCRLRGIRSGRMTTVERLVDQREVRGTMFCHDTGVLRKEEGQYDKKDRADWPREYPPRRSSATRRGAMRRASTITADANARCAIFGNRLRVGRVDRKRRGGFCVRRVKRFERNPEKETNDYRATMTHVAPRYR